MNAATIAVDLRALTTLRHECAGCPKGTPSCCAHYDICISTPEMQRIIGFIPQAAVYCPHLKTPDGFDNIFDEAGHDLFRLDTMDDERCVLAYFHEGVARCSLHRIALDLDLPLNTLKPAACLLWPLALSENEPYSLSVHEDALQFPCNRSRPLQNCLHSSVHDILATVFGRRIARAINAGVKNGESSIVVNR